MANTTLTQFPAGQTQYRVTFDYLARPFVVVTLIDSNDSTRTLVLKAGNDYRFISSTIIEISASQEGFDILQIHRFTSSDRLVDFKDGSVLTANDLTTAEVQALHIAEEGRDQTTDLARQYAEQAVAAGKNAVDIYNKIDSLVKNGYTPVGSFELGGTVSLQNDVLQFGSGPNTTHWRWEGSLPKVVPAGSTPTSTGGIARGAWWDVTDATLRGQLSAASGAAMIGYLRSNTAATRTVKDRLDDFVFLEDFGGKANDPSVDNSLAFSRAFAVSTRVRLRDAGVYFMATRDVVLPAYWEVIGNSMLSELKYIGTDTSFTMFTANGTGPEDYRQIHGGVFRDVILSADIQLKGGLVFRHLKHALWDRCFFYNVGTLMDNFHYVDYIFCERWGSPFYGAATLNTEKHISEMPRWLNCFSSNSPIDLLDTTDAVLANSIFYNGEFVVRQRYTAPGLGATDKTYGFPIHITHCVMDAVRGSALDLDRIAYFTITGNIISAGRDMGKDGVLLTNACSGSFTGNVLTYCGAFGLRIADATQCSFSGNVYNGNKSGGVSASRVSLSSLMGDVFGTSYVYGGYYVQPVGFTDPADTCKSLNLIGCQFDDSHSLKVYLDTGTESKGNRTLACTGVADTVVVIRGGTSSRPPSPLNGQQYYDTSLGMPIWWNANTNTWKRADGTDA